MRILGSISLQGYSLLNKLLSLVAVFLFIGILIHIIYNYSYAGISRSASVVIAYLMQEMGMEMFNAMSFVR